MLFGSDGYPFSAEGDPLDLVAQYEIQHTFRNGKRQFSEVLRDSHDFEELKDKRVLIGNGDVFIGMTMERWKKEGGQLYLEMRTFEDYRYEVTEKNIDLWRRAGVGVIRPIPTHVIKSPFVQAASLKNFEVKCATKEGKTGRSLVAVADAQLGRGDTTDNEWKIVKASLAADLGTNVFHETAEYRLLSYSKVGAGKTYGMVPVDDYTLTFRYRMTPEYEETPQAEIERKKARKAERKKKKVEQAEREKKQGEKADSTTSKAPKDDSTDSEASEDEPEAEQSEEEAEEQATEEQDTEDKDTDASEDEATEEKKKTKDASVNDGPDKE